MMNLIKTGTRTSSSQKGGKIMKDYDYLEKLSEWEPFIIGAHVILLEIIFLVFPVIANTLVSWYVKILIAVTGDIYLFNRFF